MTHTPLQRGYVALISVLIISFALMTLAMLAGENGFRARMNTTALEDRLAASHRARSCVSVALLQTAQDSSFRPGPEGEAIWLTQEQACTIGEISGDDELLVVRTSAVVGAGVGRVHVEAKFEPTSEVTIMKWTEL